MLMMEEELMQTDARADLYTRDINPVGDVALLATGLAVVASCNSIPSYNPPTPVYGHAAPATSSPAQYDFNWEVKYEYSGNDFGHQESRNGYDTQGAHYVLQLDGWLRRVDYIVNGDSGFVTQVN
ncbi:uncharacterized protein LOC143022331 [Oratosquilla oratoria]|uniref:uncharacterized protein LOC143022331 n=1 Tax=Oratosquilla oratoria TaxID=337810 RepID=UPI003F76F6D7